MWHEAELFSCKQGFSWLALTPLCPNISMHILHSVPVHFLGADKENLFINQELLKLLIIAFILLTFMCDSEWYCEEKLDVCHSQWIKWVNPLFWEEIDFSLTYNHKSSSDNLISTILYLKQQQLQNTVLPWIKGSSSTTQVVCQGLAAAQQLMQQVTILQRL